MFAFGVTQTPALMAIRSNGELYAFVRELADELDRHDTQSLSGDLRDALLVGTLPGEVLGAIRFVFKQVKHSDLYASRVDWRGRVDDGLAYIDSLLGPYPG